MRSINRSSSGPDPLLPQVKISHRTDEFAGRISDMTSHNLKKRRKRYNFPSSFSPMRWADKYDGAAHGAPIQGLLGYE